MAKSYPPLPPAASAEYRLDAGDQIKLDVFGLPAVSGTFTVGDDGSLMLPMIERVEARGKSVNDLQQAVADRLLERQILRAPSVGIQLLTSRPVFVIGEVKKPGEIVYRPGMTILTAISMAGGFTFRANTKSFLVSRKVGSQQVTGSADETANVQPGDVIRIRESWF